MELKTEIKKLEGNYALRIFKDNKLVSFTSTRMPGCSICNIVNSSVDKCLVIVYPEEFNNCIYEIKDINTKEILEKGILRNGEKGNGKTSRKDK